jgi:hypothetical protein
MALKMHNLVLNVLECDFDDVYEAMIYDVERKLEHIF